MISCEQYRDIMIRTNPLEMGAATVDAVMRHVALCKSCDDWLEEMFQQFKDVPGTQISAEDSARCEKLAVEAFNRLVNESN